MMHPRRILLAIDASPDSMVAAQTALDLASRTAAELIALFVEDRAEREQRAVHQVRRRLLTLRTAKPVRLTFRAVHGRPTDEILRAADDVDLVVLGRTGWSSGHRDRLGSTATEVLTRGSGQLLSAGSASGKTLIVVFSRRPEADDQPERDETR